MPSKCHVLWLTSLKWKTLPCSKKIITTQLNYTSATWFLTFCQLKTSWYKAADHCHSRPSTMNLRQMEPGHSVPRKLAPGCQVFRCLASFDESHGVVLRSDVPVQTLSHPDRSSPSPCTHTNTQTNKHQCLDYPQVPSNFKNLCVNFSFFGIFSSSCQIFNMNITMVPRIHYHNLANSRIGLDCAVFYVPANTV